MSTGHTTIPRRPDPRYLPRALKAIGLLLLAALLTALLVDRISSDDASGPASTGSGVAATQARSLPAFTGVELAAGNNVVVQVGPARQSVVVHADDNLLRRITTQVRSGTLAIGTTPGNLSARTPMYVAVTVPSLERIVLRGAGNISVSGINSERLTVALPGAGNIDAAGSAAKLDVSISGSGNALLHGLIARDARATLTGDGSIRVTATRSLTASITGTGTIDYRGDPRQVTRRISGSGTISPG